MRPSSACSLRVSPLSLNDVIKRGYFQQIRDLVNLGLDLDAKDCEGKAPLMLCGLIEPEKWGIGIARNLIENGANLSARDKHGLNAFHYACIYERLGLAQVFLNAIDFDLNQSDRLGNTALHYAAMSGNVNLTRMLVQHLNRYRIDLTKVNKRGFTAEQEAQDAGYSRCAREIQQKELLEEKGSSEFNDLHLSLTASNIESLMNDSRSCRLHQRPKTALLKRRRPFSVSSISSISSGRTQSTFSVRGRPRSKTPRKNLSPNEKNDESIIRVASTTDFRNTREYVFKMTAIPYDEFDFSERPLPDIRRPHSAWTHRNQGDNQNQPFSWRTEFKKLYVDYEFQCSASWRDAAKSIADQISCPSSPTPPEDPDEEKIKDRRARRGSLMSRNSTSSESVKEKRRSQVIPKPRKGSSGGGPHSRSVGSIDGALASSSESLSSGTSSRKKEPLIMNGKNDVNGSKIPRGNSENEDSAALEPQGRMVRAGSYTIPSVTETLVEDDDESETDGGKNDGDELQPLDSNRLSVLSDIDE